MPARFQMVVIRQSTKVLLASSILTSSSLSSLLCPAHSPFASFFQIMLSATSGTMAANRTCVVVGGGILRVEDRRRGPNLGPCTLTQNIHFQIVEGCSANNNNQHPSASSSAWILNILSPLHSIELLASRLQRQLVEPRPSSR